jgi:hypothetical protein
LGKTTERAHCSLEPLFGVSWQAVRPDQSLEVGLCRP